MWHPVRYCSELKDRLDLSLSSDVFLLPGDLYQFLSGRASTPACRDVQGDEQRIGYLMITLESLEKALRWRLGQLNDGEWQNGEINPLDLLSILDTIIWTYLQCKELIILVDESSKSGIHKHLAWDNLHYVPPGEAEQVNKTQCRAVYENYDNIVMSEDLEWPEISFAFTRRP